MGTHSNWCTCDECRGKAARLADDSARATPSPATPSPATRSIWKFRLGPPRLGGQRLWIPCADVTILSVQLQHRRPCLWIGVSPGQQKDAWLFTWTGTGADRARGGVAPYAIHAGTVLMFEERLVLHGFLHKDPDQTHDPDVDEDGNDDTPWEGS